MFYPGPIEKRAVDRFLAAQSRGVRLWLAQGGDLVEVVSPCDSSDQPLVKVRLPSGSTLTFTVRSTLHWTPLERC